MLKCATIFKYHSSYLNLKAQEFQAISQSLSNERKQHLNNFNKNKQYILKIFVSD